MTDSATTTSTGIDLTKLYFQGTELGKAPRTKWGAERLIRKHQSAIDYNLRLANLLKYGKPALIRGELPASARGTVRSYEVDKVERAVAMVVALAGGAYAYKTRDPSALIAASVGGGYAAAKIRDMLAKMRRSPELAVTKFVADRGLAAGQREAHGQAIDHAVASLEEAVEIHRRNLTALGDFLTRKSSVKREAAEEKVRTRTAKQTLTSEQRAAKRRESVTTIAGRVAKSRRH